MTIDYKYFQEKLGVEKKLVEEELKKVGRRNPDNPSDWEAVPTDKDVSQADENTVADSVENYEENLAIVNTLETRYQDIDSALDKIKNCTYGLCDVCSEEIGKDRLEANPSASTCRAHIKYMK